MFTKLRISCCLVLVTLGATSPASAAVGRELAGVNVVTGARPAQQVVQLQRPATIRLTDGLDSPDISISGQGRAVGVALEPVDGQVPILVATELQGCFVAACVSPQRYEYVSMSSALHRRQGAGPSETAYVIPAGTYRLLLLTDGAPVTVQLHLGGLSGRTALRPATPLNYEVESSSSPVGPVHPGLALATGTRQHFVRGTGFAAVVLGRIDWDVNGPGTVDACFYKGQWRAVLPQCAGGDGLKFVGGFAAASPGSQILYGGYQDPTTGGVITTGLAVAEASLVERMQMTVAWVDG